MVAEVQAAQDQSASPGAPPPATVASSVAAARDAPRWGDDADAEGDEEGFEDDMLEEDEESPSKRAQGCHHTPTTTPMTI